MRTIGAVCGDLLRNCGSAKTHMRKYLKVSQGVMLKVVLGDLLGDLLGEKEVKRGMKIKSMSKRKSSLVLEKGRIKLTRQYQVLQGMGALMRVTRNLNVCVDW